MDSARLKIELPIVKERHRNKLGASPREKKYGCTTLMWCNNGCKMLIKRMEHHLCLMNIEDMSGYLMKNGQSVSPQKERDI